MYAPQIWYHRISEVTTWSLCETLSSPCSLSPILTSTSTDRHLWPLQCEALPISEIPTACSPSGLVLIVPPTCDSTHSLYHMHVLSVVTSSALTMSSQSHETKWVPSKEKAMQEPMCARLVWWPLIFQCQTWQPDMDMRCWKSVGENLTWNTKHSCSMIWWHSSVWMSKWIVLSRDPEAVGATLHPMPPRCKWLDQAWRCPPLMGLSQRLTDHISCHPTQTTFGGPE